MARASAKLRAAALFIWQGAPSGIRVISAAAGAESEPVLVFVNDSATRPRVETVQQFIAVRHRIVHAYFDLDWQILWDVATDDIPGLHRRILHILTDGVLRFRSGAD